ncbi:MAG: hypothetical protein AAGD25_34740 [Cyanobacteria bacterium P01_F01_bin.150]
MNIQTFLNNSDTLQTLTSILNLDSSAIKQMGIEPPIGQAIVTSDRTLTQQNHWTDLLRNHRYPELPDLIEQLTSSIWPEQSAMPTDNEWQFTVTKFPLPLQIRIFLPPNTNHILSVLLDNYLMAIHQGLITGEQFNLTRQQTLIHILKAATGLRHQAIADLLFVSIETVKKHLSDIRAKQDHALQHKQAPVAIIAPANFAVAPWYLP